MKNPTKSKRLRKPSKPYPDFPLFPHATRRWAKKIRGKMFYFGPWDDADAALQLYLEQRDDLHAGRKPRSQDALTLSDLANRFLSSKRLQMEAGELSPRTWNDYYNACEATIEFFGKNAAVLDLTPEDFDKFRAELAKTRGPVSIANAILRTRILMKWAHDNELIERPVRFGTEFKRPSAKTIRKSRQEAGSRMIEASGLRRIIDAARQPLKAMILLGINCGFGQSDVASLPLAAIDLDGGWVNYPRPKTAIMRNCPLWPETVEALREALASRPKAKDPADEALAFLTQRGAKWVRHDKAATTEAIYFNDYIASEFNKLLARLELKSRGSFYNLRHVFRTVAEASKDQPAVDAIMGHADPNMGAHYRERIDDERLKAVANVVRTWLWPDAKPSATAAPSVLPFSATAG